MARQKGIFPMQGTLGNVTFFKSKDGYLARERGGVDPSKIANSPEFQRTRENNSEFGRAGKAGKVIRDAYRILMQLASDRNLVARLTAEMLRIIKLDTINARGERKVLPANLYLLLGFETNLHSKLSTTFYPPFVPTITRTTGEMTVTVAPFIPSAMLAPPAGATHFRLTIGGTDINFDENVFISETDATANLPINNTATVAISLSVTLAANSTNPLFLALAVEFLQEVNGVEYPLKNGSFNAMAFVTIDGGV